MAHSSDNAKPLAVRRSTVHAPQDLAALVADERTVCLLVLPFSPQARGQAVRSEWVSGLKSLAEKAHKDAVIAVLTTPEAAAALWPGVEGQLHFQLWISVKLRSAVRQPGGLPAHHVALLVLTKYRGSLRHTTTRIAYTFCPYCDRTTKDYGGKKHTYHSYGTLMSDVWRDIDCDPDVFPKEVVARLADLFGLPPYQNLDVIDMSRLDVMGPPLAPAATPAPTARPIVMPAAESVLLNGDCLSALREIPDDSVDFCFADPPYNLKKKYDNWNDGRDIRQYFEWCDAWLGEMARVLKPGRTLAVLNIPLWAIRHFTYLRTVLKYQAWTVWEGLSLPVRMVMPAHYSIVCFAKGIPRVPPGYSGPHPSEFEAESLNTLKEFYCLRQDCVRARRLAKHQDTEPLSDLWWDIHRLKHNSRRVDHPCQLPPALMRRLIALFTAEGELVLDPFNGAGTTTLAAEQLGRRFIGIELSPAYHELATRRHADLRAGLDPFAKTSRVPKAKNSNVKRLVKQQYAVPKKQLQLEVRRIARLLGKLPTREDVMRMGRYPIDYYDRYFISWGEVCAAARHAGMSETREPAARQACRSQALLFDPDA